MPSTKTTPSHLQERVATTLRRLDELESAYQTITVPQLVSMRARTHGSSAAIDIFERNERATYHEMDRLSNRYARSLQRFGVCKGDRVGVMLPNRIEFPILWFAVAKLGAVLVPINMRYTPREIEYVLSDTQTKIAVVDESAWPVFSQMDPWPRDLARKQVILVGGCPDATATTLDELVKDETDSPVDVDVAPDDLLHIQYTSGTTGFPKGCMLTHDYWGVFSYASASRDFRPYQRYLSVAPFYYVDGPHLLLKSYRQGGTLYWAPQLSSTRFMDWLKKYRIEWVQVPELIARQPPAPDDTFLHLKQVHQYGGWSSDTVHRFRERFPGVFNNGYYGMTEIGSGTQFPGDFEETVETGSLGLRAPFRELRLVNGDGSTTPVGEDGELWVKGRGVFKGYWNRPEANAAQFEGDWFKTGDLLRCDEFGFYWLVGRTKDMIRRSGENIAAREVEAIIREIAEIAEVAAVPVRDVKRGEEVKIYVELKEGLSPDDLPVERILEYARARLAAFKVPRYVAFIAAIPKTATSNKVAKGELIAAADPLAGVYDNEEKRWL